MKLADVPEVMIRLDDGGAADPLYVQIYRGLRRAILEGRLAPGERIPPTRSLSDRLQVSRTSVLEAYRQLRREGYIEARVGSGTYVSERLPEDMTTVSPASGGRPGGREPPEESATSAVPRLSRRVRRLQPAIHPTPELPGAIRYDFRVGCLDPDDFPRAAWRRIATRHGARMPTSYGPAAGDPALREALARYVAAARGIACEPDRVVVVAGARQAFDLLARLLVDPGDPVVLEEPHYGDARTALVAAGANPIGVPVDRDGLRTDRLPDDRERVPLAYVTPSHQFPTGGILPLDRRIELLEWAGDHGAFLVEDDYDAEFQYEVRPIQALGALDRAGRVAYVGTFSKTLSPDLRIGWAVLPPPLVEPFLALKRVADRQCPRLTQRILAELLEEGHFGRHVRRMRTRHAARREALLEALERRLEDRAVATGREAGVHLMVRLPGLGAHRVPELVRRAAAAGVALSTLDEHCLSPPPSAGILLGYAALDPEEIPGGVERLAAAMEAVERERAPEPGDATPRG